MRNKDFRVLILSLRVYYNYYITILGIGIPTTKILLIKKNICNYVLSYFNITLTVERKR